MRDEREVQRDQGHGLGRMLKEVQTDQRRGLGCVMRERCREIRVTGWDG